MSLDSTQLPNDRNKMPDEDAHFDNWFESAVPPEPYTEQHLRWAFNAGGMVQRLLTSQSNGAPQVREVIERLGFDPTNHHNAVKCPYCTPQREMPTPEEIEAIIAKAKEDKPPECSEEGCGCTYWHSAFCNKCGHLQAPVVVRTEQASGDILCRMLIRVIIDGNCIATFDPSKITALDDEAFFEFTDSVGDGPTMRLEFFERE